ncbi:Hypothetical predicted protein [Mytilus galloprovincialis]|uniref:Uncharacterized protein n=1 Tax=Mytilus galloprovincialis TaxID=29158 RepID=A0A8B6G1Z7_MYTGA|nr:Hypothetical predicted protein [Mytilus galloprovincialis]
MMGKLPLNEQKVDSVDYAGQTIIHDKEQNLFMNELRNLISLFHNQLGEITHEFSNCQKEVIIAVNQMKRDFEDEISSTKGRISQIEDAVHENKKNISTNYDQKYKGSPFIGQIDVKICLGNYIYHHNVLVADISNEGIIGMDFLVTHDCDVLLSQNKLKIKGEIIQCYHYASSAKSCYRVAIQETVDVPPNSEMIVSGESDEPIFRGLAGLIEPNEKFMEKNGLLVARSIVHPEMYNIPLRIINLNKEPCTLYKGTIIATCNKVDEEDIQTSEFVK